MGTPLALRRRASLALAVASLAVVSVAVPASQASHGAYTVVELAPGYTSVGVSDVNNAGDVVGGYVDAQGVAHGFVIDAGGLRDVTGDDGFLPRAINDRGEMAGTIELVVDELRATHAAFRDASGTVRDLGTLGGGPSSVALDLNEQGHVVGYSEINEGRERAFIFDGSQIAQIGPLGASVPSVHATSINDRGQVVGFDDRGDFGTSQAFLYENGQTTLLAAEPGAQGVFASGINERGVISGWADRYYGTLITGSPVRWQEGASEQLGAYGFTSAINCHGEAVGTHTSSLGGAQLAVLYGEGGIIGLEQELPSGDRARLARSTTAGRSSSTNPPEAPRARTC